MTETARGRVVNNVELAACFGAACSTVRQARPDAGRRTAIGFLPSLMAPTVEMAAPLQLFGSLDFLMQALLLSQKLLELAHGVGLVVTT